MPQKVEPREELAAIFVEEVRALEEIVKRIGFGAYACLLIRALFFDALSVTGDEKACRSMMPSLMTAVLLMFIKVNGYDYTVTPDLYYLFGSEKQETEELYQELKAKLDVRVFDPRYLTEDGVVLSLYLLVQENKPDRAHLFLKYVFGWEIGAFRLWRNAPICVITSTRCPPLL
jgi:hypothetical protein